MNAIKIDNLHKQFDKTLAVGGIDLEIKEGIIFGLLGPNGAGKSTTINMISGNISIDRGEIRVLGKSLKNKSKEIKKEIGIIPQELAIFDDLSAYENIKLFGLLYGISNKEIDDKVNEALLFVGLEDKKNDLVKQFSGGMKRRVNIACGIVHTPKIVIMDEPTVGIDPQSRNYILKSIQKLNKQGTTVLYTTHYINEAEQLCDEIAIIDQGRISAQGSLKQLQNMVSEYTIMEVEVGNLRALQAEGLKEIEGVISVEIKEKRLIIRLNKEINPIDEILIILGMQKVQVLNISIKKPNLEDVFLNLTGKALRD